MKKLTIHALRDPVKTVVLVSPIVISLTPFTRVNVSLVSTASSVSTRLMSVSMHLVKMVASARIYRLVPFFPELNRQINRAILNVHVHPDGWAKPVKLVSCFKLLFFQLSLGKKKLVMSAYFSN